MSRPAALTIGFATLMLALAFAVWGGWSAWSAIAGPQPARSAVMDAGTARALTIPANTRGEAEAATLRRVVGALQGEGVMLRTGSFKASADQRLVSMTFDFDGPPDAMWRAVHAMEAGSPALVITRLRATARDNGAMLAISADALAAWAPPEAAPPAQPVAAPATGGGE